MAIKLLEFTKLITVSFIVGTVNNNLVKGLEQNQTGTNGTESDLPKRHFYENKVIANVINSKEEVLKTELVSVAGGFNLKLKTNGQNKSHREQRITALAILNKMMDLGVMEQMDGVIAHCTLHSSLAFLSDKDGFLRINETETVNKHKGDNAELFALWLQSMVTFIKKDPQLNETFEKSKTEVQNDLANENLPQVVEAQSRHDRMVNSQLFRRSELNELFLKQSADYTDMINWDADHCKRFLLARSLIDLSKRLGLAQKLNKIYKETLDQVAKDYSATITEKEKRDKLFLQLENNIKGDRGLDEMVKSCERTLHVWYSFRLLRRRNNSTSEYEKKD